MIQNFAAGVRYNDYQGSVAADNADTSTLFPFLSQYFELSKDDVILSVTTFANYFGRTTELENLSLTILVSADENYNEKMEKGEPINVREFNKDISITDFFKLFKQFELTLSRKGDFEHKKYVVVNK